MQIQKSIKDKEVSEKNHVTATFSRKLCQLSLSNKTGDFQPLCLGLITLKKNLIILESPWSSVTIRGEDVKVALALLKKCDGTKNLNQLVDCLGHTITKKSALCFLRELSREGFVCDSREVYLPMHRFACNPSPYYRTPCDSDILRMLSHSHEEKIKAKTPIVSLSKKNTILGKYLASRSSVRDYDQNYKYSVKTLGTILWTIYGITSEKRITKNVISKSHTVPSGGCLYPLEIYATLVRGIDTIKPGTYRYRSENRDLILSNKDCDSLIQSIVDENAQQSAMDSGLVITIVGNFSRSTKKYSNRGYLYVLYETGAAMQNCYLIASELNLGCCAIGGFREIETAKALGLSDFPNTMPLLTIFIGKPRRKKDEIFNE